MTKSSIIIKGARQNNLKNIDLTIPRDKFVVFTGLSGSGKSSLALDTIYAEGQRRYLESLNTYARQFLGSMDKPDLDYIEGLSPSIAIEQKAVSKNPRSTVGTVTEIYDYLRLLYANIGTPHCPKCGKVINPLTTQEITAQILKKLEIKSKFRILAPIIQRRKGEYSAVFRQLKKEGYVRIIVDDIEYELDEDIELDRNKFHDIDVVLDRLIMKDNDQFKKRLADAVEQASRLTEGLVKVWVVDKEPVLYSEHLFCTSCVISMPELKPQLFSFNTPLGLCPACNGLGKSYEFTEHGIFPDKTKNVYKSKLRSVGGFGTLNTYSWGILETLAEHYNVDLNDSIEDLPEDFWDVFLLGSGDKKFEFQFDSNDKKNSRREFSYRVKRPFEGILI